MPESAGSPDVTAILRSRAFIGLLLLAAIVGVVASLAAWGFLELVHQVQVGVWDKLPDLVGYDDGAPLWWAVPVLAIAGAVVAVAIVRLPGEGGHVPAEGLKTGVTQPIELPGVLLAAVAGIGLGVVLGPEAPLIALGGGLGVFVIRRVRKDAPEELTAVMAAAGTFAALAMIFESPLIASVVVIEAAGLGGQRLPVVLVPGILAAGIGSLLLVGMGSWTGLNTEDIAIGILDLPNFARPAAADVGWSILLAAATAVVVFVVIRLAREAHPRFMVRPFVLLPLAAIAVAGLAIAFAETTDKGVDQVLFSGQNAIGPLVSDASSWSLTALALLIAFKGIAWTISLGAFRGGPVFPSLLLGAAAGLMAAQLPGFSITPAVTVGMGAAVASVLRLPLSAVVLAVLLSSNSGLGAAPLVIVGVVVAYVTTQMLWGTVSDDRRGPDAPVEGRDHVLST
jgi:H+/Cl- antiporter ClcA